MTEKPSKTRIDIKTSAAPETDTSYAELNAELEEVLATLQHEDIDVDQAMEAYQRGMMLVAQLDSYLREAETKIIKLKADFSA